MKSVFSFSFGTHYHIAVGKARMCGEIALYMADKGLDAGIGVIKAPKQHLVMLEQPGKPELFELRAVIKQQPVASDIDILPALQSGHGVRQRAAEAAFRHHAGLAEGLMGRAAVDIDLEIIENEEGVVPEIGKRFRQEGGSSEYRDNHVSPRRGQS